MKLGITSIINDLTISFVNWLFLNNGKESTVRFASYPVNFSVFISPFKILQNEAHIFLSYWFTTEFSYISGLLLSFLTN
jgi:hypothetical protein